MKRLVYLFVITCLLSFGCGNQAEAPPPQPKAAAANTGPIDPKSLFDTKSETVLLFDEIGGKAPTPGIPIVVKTPSFVVRGWAIDQEAKSVAGGVIC